MPCLLLEKKKKRQSERLDALCSGRKFLLWFGKQQQNRNRLRSAGTGVLEMRKKAPVVGLPGQARQWQFFITIRTENPDFTRGWMPRCRNNTAPRQWAWSNRRFVFLIEPPVLLGDIYFVISLHFSFLLVSPVWPENLRGSRVALRLPEDDTEGRAASHAAFKL